MHCSLPTPGGELCAHRRSPGTGTVFISRGPREKRYAAQIEIYERNQPVLRISDAPLPQVHFRCPRCTRRPLARLPSVIPRQRWNLFRKHPATVTIPKRSDRVRMLLSATAAVSPPSTRVSLVRACIIHIIYTNQISRCFERFTFEFWSLGRTIQTSAAAYRVVRV